MNWLKQKMTIEELTITTKNLNDEFIDSTPLDIHVVVFFLFHLNTGTANLQQKWKDGLAILRIIFKFLAIQSMLSFRPNGHLNQTGNGEQMGRNALCHHSKRKP